MENNSGQKFRDLRVSRNIKRCELSQKSGVSLPQITNIEKGRIINPHVITLSKLSKALECDFEEIYKIFYN